MANVTISSLPTAGALTGSESVPVVQNGVTVQTTTGAIAGAGNLNYPFLTVGSTSGLTEARYIATGSGLSITDNGAGSTLQINLTGAAQSLDGASTGLIVKTGTTTVTSRSIAVGSSMTISNADGTAGNPTIGLNATLQNFGSTSGTGILSINGTSVGVFTLQGTSNQIAVTNGNASSGSPTVGLASNPTLPGNSFVQLPSGTTAQRGSPAYGAFRYNTDIASLEAYTSSGWGAVVSGSGVTTFSGGTTGLTPATPTAGGIVLGGTLSAGSGGTGATSLTGYVYGNGTGAMTASTTIPTTALSGTITNAQLANSSITINGNLVSLGGSTTVSAVTTNPLTIGTGLSGTSFNGSAPVTIAIANTGVSAGSYGSALAIPQITVNAQGQITSITTNASGATTYQGTWNASTNTPTLASSSGTNGYYYLVSTAGTTNLNGINLWSVGDWAVFNGSVWEKVNGSSSEAFAAITVTGLTGYMYGNGTSQVTASTTIPTSALSGQVALANGGTNANLTATAGGVIYSGSSAFAVSAAGTSGQVLTSGGTGAPTWTSLSSIGVTSINFGTTGLTPSTATSGAVTVAGTLNVANGGTGLTSLTSGYVPYGNGTGAFASSSAFTYASSTLTAPIHTATATISTSNNIGAFSYGTLSYSDTNIFASYTTNVNSYAQMILENSSTGSAASADFIVSSNSGTSSTYYGDFGINGSGFTGSGAFQGANNTYLYAQNGDLAIGTQTSNAIHFIVGSATASDAATISSSGVFSLATALAVSSGGTGVATLSGLAYGNGTSAFTAATASQIVTAIGTTAVTNATNATNVALTAGSGATNYLHFSASATGNQPVNTNSSLTYNYTNNAITGGINGGTF